MGLHLYKACSVLSMFVQGNNRNSVHTVNKNRLGTTILGLCPHFSSDKCVLFLANCSRLSER